MPNWQERRTMTPAEYAGALEVLGLNISSAGRYLGCSARTSMRYIRGESEVPVAEVLLLRALIAKRIKPIVPAWRADKRGW
jgi:hypothetical protein